MSARTQLQADAVADTEEGRSAPTVSVCESSPGTTVFLESGNTDGWIASDTTVEPER